MAIIQGTKGIQAVKLVKGKLRNFPTVEMWDISGNANPYALDSEITVFRPDGKAITTQDAEDDNRLYEFGLSDLEFPSSSTEKFSVKASSGVYCPLKPELLLVGRVNGQLDVVSYTGYTSAAKIHCHLNSHSSVKISACAWSQDGNWIATGNDHGHIYLWDASVTTSISLARRPHLPRATDRTCPITSLIFVPDSTALIIFCGGYLTLWDIAKGVYVDNSGLPATATNIALVGLRTARITGTAVSFTAVILPWST
jgi:WD40 repeat protein